MSTENLATVDSAQAVPQRLRPFDSLRNRDFRLMWFVNWFWYHAKWMETVVLGWVVLVLTDSPGLVAVVGFFRYGPMPVFGLLAGILADRANRKLIIMTSQVVNLAGVTILFLLMASHVVQFWHIALVSLAMGIAWTMDFAAR